MIFDSCKPGVLIITPYHKQARGNTHTSKRLYNGLKQRRWPVDLISLESDNWPQMLDEMLAQNYYSLIHGLNITHFTKVITSFPHLTRFPLILTMTGTDVNYDIKTEPNIARVLRTVNKIVIFNDYFRSVFKNHCPDIVTKLITIPQGVALEPYQGISRSQFGFNKDHFIFLLPSGIRPVKNLDLAINALETLVPEFSQLRLLILGTVIDYQYNSHIMKRIKGLPWVVYPGEFPHSQMYNLLQLGDVVLNSSLSEGQPQAALEAMSLGKPCILTAVPGNLNTITDGKEGYYVKDENELAAAARKLMLNHKLREDMGTNARKLVYEKFSPAKELKAYEELYKKILAVG